LTRARIKFANISSLVVRLEVGGLKYCSRRTMMSSLTHLRSRKPRGYKGQQLCCATSHWAYISTAMHKNNCTVLLKKAARLCEYVIPDTPAQQQRLADKNNLYDVHPSGRWGY
jgi:hypothetical protein